MGSVLIIDAEEDFAQQLASEVRSRGVEPTLTSDGKAGLDMAHINIPDAIVLCVELPRMSGYSICAKLKKDATLKGVPLIITSAEATQETFEHHKKLKTRAEEYMKKPFAPKDLMDILGRYVDFSAPANGEEQPPVLEDDEAFSADETLAMTAGEMPPDLDDELIEVDEAVPIDADVGLEGSAGLSEGFGDDEVMTTIGHPPGPPADSSPPAESTADLADLKRLLAVEREGRAKAERERDLAVANEKAAAAQAQAVNASTPPTAASQSRELLEIKKQLNAKEHELLELTDKIHEKDKQILGLRDKEMELEGQVVQAQEDAENAGRARAEAEGKIAAAETRAEEIEKSSHQQLEELNRQLGQAAAHEAELDGALQSKTEEAEQLAQQLEAKDEEIATHKRTQQQLNGEITKVTNELSAANAESDSLRQQVSEKEEKVAEEAQGREQAEAKVAELESELASTRESLQGAEDRAARAYQRIRDDEETKGKAKQAIEIAIALLSGEDGGQADA